VAEEEDSVRSVKSAVWFLLAMVVAGLAWASPNVENGKLYLTKKEKGPEPERVTLTLLGGKGPQYDTAIARLIERSKPVELAVRWLNLNLADGTTISMDTLVAAGAYPNVYNDFTGRASRFMIRTAGWKAMDLTPYVDVKGYFDLVPWQRGGLLLGVPGVVPLQGIALNLDLLDAAGYKLPDAKDWTIDAFLAMCEAVKAKLPGKWGTALFAKSASADYLWMNWFGSFGAQVFVGGDYTRTAINSAQGVATLRFLQALVQKGYAPMDSAELWDDAALELWQRGIVAAMPIRPDWVAAFMKGALDQKMIAKAFRWVMYPFPRGPGVPAVPTLGAGSTAVVGESGNGRLDSFAGQLAAALGDRAYQDETMASIGGSWPTIRGVAEVPNGSAEDVAAWKVVNEIVQKAGIMDVGYTLSGYSAIRGELFPRLVELYNGKTTPEAALATYEKRVNEILAGK